MTTLLHIVGARPNFMKVAALLRGTPSGAPVRHLLVHTGQHYDADMSDAFFRDLGLPAPDFHLGVGSGSHAAQTARIMLESERVILDSRPDWVVVYGDVNSTLACALVAVKEGIRIAHVEAGVRSFDRRMPEEVNRVLVDAIADLCLTPSSDADQNLAREGVPPERIRCVGNVMVDTLLSVREQARAVGAPATQQVTPGRYAFATFHRAGNVDDPMTLAAIAGALNRIAERAPVLFAVHPRTRKRLEEFGLANALTRVRLLDPLGYLETVDLAQHAGVVLTDSGGLQVETTVLGVPCLTVRPSTEWTATLTEGTNRLVTAGEAAPIAIDLLDARARGSWQARTPEGWDGQAGRRIVEILSTY